jgi:transposase InsO family protein
MSRRKKSSLHRRRRSSSPSVSSALPPCPTFEREGGGPVPTEVREHALVLLASGIKPCVVASQIGVTTESLRLWRHRAEEEGTMPKPPRLATRSESTPSTPTLPPPGPKPSVPQRAPHDPATGLAAHEVEAILDLKRQHPSMGPAQIRAQLKRFKGWRVSIRAIARALKRAGYELVHVASRPKGEEIVQSFEAPHRNALWQMDFAELRVGPERVALLVVLDDFSRYVVGYELMEEVSSERVVSVLQAAIRRHGKPESIYTDRGGPFLSWNKPSSLGSFLEAELIDHAVSPAYRPQGRGKVEALIGTIRRELWDIVHFESVERAREEVASFFRRYNEQRAHIGIDGLTPADRFFGRWEEIRDRVDAASRKRQGALLAASPLLSGGNGHGRVEDPFAGEEALPGAPLELLRLLVAGGRLELRFLGYRVDLGEVKP